MGEARIIGMIIRLEMKGRDLINSCSVGLVASCSFMGGVFVVRPLLLAFISAMEMIVLVILFLFFFLLLRCFM